MIQNKGKKCCKKGKRYPSAIQGQLLPPHLFHTSQATWMGWPVQSGPVGMQEPPPMAMGSGFGGMPGQPPMGMKGASVSGQPPMGPGMDMRQQRQPPMGSGMAMSGQPMGMGSGMGMQQQPQPAPGMVSKLQDRDQQPPGPVMASMLQGRDPQPPEGMGRPTTYAQWVIATALQEPLSPELIRDWGAPKSRYNLDGSRRVERSRYTLEGSRRVKRGERGEQEDSDDDPERYATGWGRVRALMHHRGNVR